MQVKIHKDGITFRFTTGEINRLRYILSEFELYFTTESKTWKKEMSLIDNILYPIICPFKFPNSKKLSTVPTRDEREI